MREDNQMLELVAAATSMMEYSMAGFAKDRQPMLTAVTAAREVE